MRSQHFLSSGGGTIARADNTITSIKITNTPQGEDICVGDFVTYQAIVNGADPRTNVAWDYMILGCTPAEGWTSWIATGANLAASRQENAAGSLRLRVKVTFQRYPMPDTYVVEKTADITINPPDEIAIDPDYLDTPFPLATQNQPNIAVPLKILRKGRDTYVQATILERLERSKYLPGQDDLPWSVVPYLSCTGPGEVTDYKGIYITPAELPNWNGQLANFLADEFDQSYRIRLNKTCGGTEDFDLSPTYHFQFLKVDDGHWKLVQVEE